MELKDLLSYPTKEAALSALSKMYDTKNEETAPVMFMLCEEEFNKKENSLDYSPVVGFDNQLIYSEDVGVIHRIADRFNNISKETHVYCNLKILAISKKQCNEMLFCFREWTDSLNSLSTKCLSLSDALSYLGFGYTSEINDKIMNAVFTNVKHAGYAFSKNKQDELMIVCRSDKDYESFEEDEDSVEEDYDDEEDYDVIYESIKKIEEIIKSVSSSKSTPNNAVDIEGLINYILS